jgi:hypothetical protein
MGIFNDKAARRAREERANAPIKHEGKFLSWGGSGRSSTRPENQGLSKREIDALDAENAKSGRYGMHGAKYISSNAREAQRRGRGK